MLEFTPENIMFLRNGAGLSIDELSRILSVKSSNLYAYETIGYKFGKTGGHEEKKDFIEICSFFIVLLDDLVFTDLRVAGIIDKDFFRSLRKSLYNKSPEPLLIEKTKFNKTFLANMEIIPGGDGTSIAKYLLRLVHSVYQTPDIYQPFRRLLP